MSLQHRFLYANSVCALSIETCDSAHFIVDILSITLYYCLLRMRNKEYTLQLYVTAVSCFSNMGLRRTTPVSKPSLSTTQTATSTERRSGLTPDGQFFGVVGKSQRCRSVNGQTTVLSSTLGLNGVNGA